MVLSPLSPSFDDHVLFLLLICPSWLKQNRVRARQAAAQFLTSFCRMPAGTRPLADKKVPKSRRVSDEVSSNFHRTLGPWEATIRVPLKDRHCLGRPKRNNRLSDGRRCSPTWLDAPGRQRWTFDNSCIHRWSTEEEQAVGEELSHQGIGISVPVPAARGASAQALLARYTTDLILARQPRLGGLVGTGTALGDTAGRWRG